MWLRAILLLLAPTLLFYALGRWHRYGDRFFHGWWRDSLLVSSLTLLGWPLLFRQPRLFFAVPFVTSATIVGLWWLRDVRWQRLLEGLKRQRGREAVRLQIMHRLPPLPSDPSAWQVRQRLYTSSAMIQAELPTTARDVLEPLKLHTLDDGARSYAVTNLAIALLMLKEREPARELLLDNLWPQLKNPQRDLLRCYGALALALDGQARKAEETLALVSAKAATSIAAALTLASIAAQRGDDASARQILEDLRESNGEGSLRQLVHFGGPAAAIADRLLERPSHNPYRRPG